MILNFSVNIGETAMLVFRILLAVALFTVINKVGDIARPLGYVDFLELYKTNAFGLNIVFRTFAPPIAVGLVSVALFRIGLDEMTADLWQVVVFYWAFRFVYYLFRNWWSLIPRTLFVAQAAVSIATAYYFQRNMIDAGPAALVPTVEDVTFQFWVLVLGFFYAILNGYQPPAGVNPPLKALRNRFLDFEQRFEPLLNERFKQDLILRSLFFTFMLMEDFNRSPMIRWAERAAARVGLAKTTGIMQVSAPGKVLSDEESIRRAQSMIAEIFDDYYSEHILPNEHAARIEVFNSMPTMYQYDYRQLSYDISAEELYRQYSGNGFSHVYDIFHMVVESSASALGYGDSTMVSVYLSTPVPNIDDEFQESFDDGEPANDVGEAV